MPCFNWKWAVLIRFCLCNTFIFKQYLKKHLSFCNKLLYHNSLYPKSQKVKSQEWIFCFCVTLSFPVNIFQKPFTFWIEILLIKEESYWFWRSKVKVMCLTSCILIHFVGLFVGRKFKEEYLIICKYNPRGLCRKYNGGGILKKNYLWRSTNWHKSLVWPFKWEIGWWSEVVSKMVSSLFFFPPRKLLL